MDKFFFKNFSKRQVNFIQKMVLGKLPISFDSIQMTNAILFKEELSEGWKLFGKTGWSGSDKEKMVKL
jgi:beta-lactamase class D